MSSKAILVVPAGGNEAYHFSNEVTTAAKLYGYTPEIVPEAVALDSQSLDASRRQWRADVIIQTISDAVGRRSSGKVVVVTSVDLFLPKLNFVFGLADRSRGVAVVSLARLKGPQSYDSSKIVQERVFKEVAHEIGHLVGLDHCVESDNCIMTFANSLQDVDAKLPMLCTSCQRKAGI